MIHIRFYYEKYSGDYYGHFTMRKDEIPRAIMTAYNINANLSIVLKDLDKHKEICKLIFSPLEDNEVNNEYLKEYGLYLKDGEEYIEIHYIKDDSFAWEPGSWEGILDLS